MLQSDAPMLTQLQWGLPQNLRVAAATLIYDTFHRKFKYSLGPRQKGIRLIAYSFREEYALVALQGEKLVGLAGVKNSHGELIEMQFSLWLRTYHFHTIRSFLIGFPIWYERITPSVLKLTNLCVVESVREHGLGTRMIQEFIRYGMDKGYQVLKLEVIN
jgi:ribosomal protein S18 acetylase RimI-like enzyme